MVFILKRAKSFGLESYELGQCYMYIRPASIFSCDQAALDIDIDIDIDNIYSTYSNWLHIVQFFMQHNHLKNKIR